MKFPELASLFCKNLIYYHYCLQNHVNVHTSHMCSGLPLEGIGYTNVITTNKMTSIRIVTMDHCMIAPLVGFDCYYSEFRGSTIQKVPIIRIFGTTNAGTKACLHVHGVFPYIYIPYDGTADPNTIAYQIASALDKAINISMSQASSSQQHVFKVNLVSAKPFYGYHASEHQFLKLSFYNPLIIRRAASLLETGTILGKIYQPHESHIPYHQQFMIDCNLHGMNFIRLSEVKYRVNEVTNDKPDGIKKVSTCEEEMDAKVEWILNLHEVSQGAMTANPGIQYICEDEKQRRRNKNQDTQLSPCLTENRLHIVPTATHTKLKKLLENKLKLVQSNERATASNPDMSVYAAETPVTHSLLSASCVLDHTFLDTSCVEVDVSNVNLDVSLIDDDVNLFLGMYQEKHNGEDEETDSVLSQAAKREDDGSDNEFDLSIPLAANTTPLKIIPQPESDDDDLFNDSFFEQTLQFPDSDAMDSSTKNDVIPQIDGIIDSSDESDSGEAGNPMKLKEGVPELPNDTFADKNAQKPAKGKENSSTSKISLIDTGGKHDIKFKRKLDFMQNSFLNSTSIEENITCRYTPRKNSSESGENVISPAVSDKSNYSDDIFSPDNITDKFTAVEKYDFESNVLPVAGTSTTLTVPYKHIVENDDMETSSSGNITPYQVVKSPNECNQTDNLNYSSGEITPYQPVRSPEPQVCEHKSLNATLNLSHPNSLSPKMQPDTTFEDFDTTFINNSTDDTTLLNNTNGFCIIRPSQDPPTRTYIESSMSTHNIPHVRNTDPFYSDMDHVTGTVEVGLNVLKIESKSITDLPDFESNFLGVANLQLYEMKTLCPNPQLKDICSVKMSHCGNNRCIVEPLHKPPTKREVELWLKAKKVRKMEVIVPKKQKIKHYIQNEDGDSENELSLTISSNTPEKAPQRCSIETTEDGDTTFQNILMQSSLFKESDLSTTSNQITGATLNNTHGFKMTLENLQEGRSCIEHQFLTTLVIELHIQTRGDFKPDPQHDAIRAIFYSLLNDKPNANSESITGCFVVNSQLISPDKNKKTNVLDGAGVACDIRYVDSEHDLYMKFLEFIKEIDPDILIGYEIEMLSWGYLIDRGYVLSLNLVSQLSRIPDTTNRKNREEESHSELKITGRVVLDLWRLLKHEIALQSYTFENIVFHVLHQRVSLHSFKDLTNWWVHRSPKIRHRTVHFYLYRVKGILKLLDHYDLIGRTSELARLFGILFYEVLSRGSQFRVESMMLRLAKPMNFIPVSPSVQQRANMRAPEYLPLILEPESKFYKDPVIVLDFQSLYPSIIIGYNYCFSTCMGRIEHLGSNLPFEFGATQLKISKRRVIKLVEKDLVNIAPTGVVFVKKDVSHGILPRMLQEILDTRLLVKKAMKDEKGNKVMQRVLHSRQLGLKLIANVTYGYTAANFSGRMPSVEVGDSVVAKGRETLQRAINLVETTPEWGARVVYGDTDSMFVLVAGRSRDDAFKIGAEIADAVTNANPSPVKLKLEKVYQPCILQTKKRYVGYMYESADQEEPEFQAKGIETVRRDGCPAVSKMLEKCLRMLFETKDISPIKTYVLRQFDKLLSGRVSIQDLTFAKEYRGMASYKPGACVPALELTKRWMTTDKRREPRNGERVPYVIINGPPGLPLIRMVRSPMELLEDVSLRPNALYYITKVIIPPINRCFKLLGADLHVWFNEMPRKQIQYLPTSSPSKGPKSTISQYFATTSCVGCGQQTKSGICEDCQANSQNTGVILHEKLRMWERNHFESIKICQSCCGRTVDINCTSLDCPLLYHTNQTNRDLQQATYVRDLIQKLPELYF